MVGLQVGILADVLVGDVGVADEALVIVAADGTGGHHEVVPVEHGDDTVEYAQADAHTLGMQVVEQVCRGVERMAEYLHLVVLVESLKQLLVHLGAVGIGEDVAEVVDGLVESVAVDAVVVDDALADVVFHLETHLVLGGYGHDGDDGEDDADDGQDDEFADAAVQEFLCDALLLVGIAVKLFHDVKDV